MSGTTSALLDIVVPGNSSLFAAELESCFFADRSVYSPVKLVAIVLKEWEEGQGGGGGCEEGDTTLLNNCSGSQIKNSTASIEGTRILLCGHGRNSF